MKGKNPKLEYLENCAKQMKLRYDGPIKIRITKAANPMNYPRGAWFDSHIDEIMEPIGVDLNSVPKLFVMGNGDVIPFSCADAIEKGMIRLGDYYIHFRVQQPGYVEPESGDNMWQLSLGFVVITRMR